MSSKVKPGEERMRESKYPFFRPELLVLELLDDASEAEHELRASATPKKSSLIR